ncbi:hypothetical protein, partial [Methylomagnum sp.]
NFHGLVPEQYRRSFGAKARIVVLLNDAESESIPAKGQANKLMEFAGKLDWPIADPVAFQQELRKEWGRE